MIHIWFAIFHWFQNVTGTNIGVNGTTPRWYNFHSGFEGDYAIYAGIFMLYWKHNCHQAWCWRIGRHTTKGGQIVCKRHHPDMGKGFQITSKHILNLHKRVK